MDSDSQYMDVILDLINASEKNTSLELFANFLLSETGASSAIIYLLNEDENQFLPEICIQSNGVNRGKLLSAIPTISNNASIDPVQHCYQKRTKFEANLDKRNDKLNINSILLHDAIIGTKSKRLYCSPLLNINNNVTGVVMLLFSSGEHKYGFPDLLSKLTQIAARIFDIEKTYLRNSRLVHILNNTSEKLRLENDKLKSSLNKDRALSSVIGRSAKMRELGQLVKKVTNSDVAVLVLGETGTGKELIAGSLHQLSERKYNPFVVQNCAAIPENLLESELFGYRKGAFSGANQDKKGLIEQADGGTLFLDEIGDMPINLQAKLLRVLQEKKIRPLGSSAAAERSVDVRFVAATHQDLLSKVRSGEFREDLYYRLSVFPIKLPPLRERREDIPELINHFIKEFTEKYQKKISGMTPLVMNILMKYQYPGNIRDLRNIIERAVLLVDNGGYIDYPVLGEDMIAFLNPGLNMTEAISEGVSLKSAMEQYEARYIRDALKNCNWNQTKAAEKLGIARRTIIEKIQKYSINRYIAELDTTLQ